MGEPAIRRNLDDEKPAFVKAALAGSWLSASTSIDVSTPSVAIASRKLSPDAPMRVPTSTTALAAMARVSTCRVATTPVETGVRPARLASSRISATSGEGAIRSSAKVQLATLGD